MAAGTNSGINQTGRIGTYSGPGMQVGAGNIKPASQSQLSGSLNTAFTNIGNNPNVGYNQAPPTTYNANPVSNGQMGTSGGKAPVGGASPGNLFRAQNRMEKMGAGMGAQMSSDPAQQAKAQKLIDAAMGMGAGLSFGAQRAGIEANNKNGFGGWG